MITRRTFLSRTAGIAGVALLAPQMSCGEERAPVLVNHVGFTPQAGKVALLKGPGGGAFQVVNTVNGQTVHEGHFEDRRGDLGIWQVADLSVLRQPGRYRIVSGTSQSGEFAVDTAIYQPGIEACIGYFAVQRCGNSTTGYNAPCHLDDGIRRDNGAYRDVTGGWHDACDVRKWVSATIHGMIGLWRVLDVLGHERIDRQRVIDELRWGNQYFLKMQEPDGYVMDWCGGDDGNHFTDNRRNTADDRRITVDPVRVPSQFHFVTAQAAMSMLIRSDDADYADRCLEAGMRCLMWCRERRRPRTAISLAAGVIACAQMSAATDDPRPLEWANDYMARLLALQATHPLSDDAPVSGYFREKDDTDAPAMDIMEGNLPLIALCVMLERFPHNENASAWQSALQKHVEYLQALSALSAFGTIPYGLYLGKDPGGNRRLGRYWYRWFMKTADTDWWVGINAHLASHGVGLCRAARVLDKTSLFALAQRQLDWILGVNPFNASTITGVGRNQPRLYRPGTFHPPTPPIKGGVMNGIGGTIDDQPDLSPGSWQTCEYWTPMVSYAMWLMAELQVVG